MKRLFWILLFLWIASPPLLGYWIEQQIQQHLPHLQAQLAQTGYQIQLLHYRRGFWQSQAQWQIRYQGNNISLIDSQVQQGFLSSAGANLLRLTWKSSPQGEFAMPELALKGNLRLNLLGNVVFEVQSQQEASVLKADSHAQLHFSLFSRRDFYVRAHNHAQHNALPALTLSAHIQRQRDQAPAKIALPPILKSLVQDRWLANATLTLFPQDPSAEIQITAHVQEQINNPLQLAALAYRQSIINFLENSSLHIQMPNNHHHPQAVLDFLAQAPLNLKGELEHKTDGWHSAWKVEQGKLVQSLP